MRGESICYKIAFDSHEELVGEGRKRCWAKRILWSPRSHQRGGRSDGYRSIESSPSTFCTHPVKFREVNSEIENKQRSAGEQGASWRNGHGLTPDSLLIHRHVTTSRIFLTAPLSLHQQRHEYLPLPSPLEQRSPLAPSFASPFPCCSPFSHRCTNTTSTAVDAGIRSHLQNAQGS